VSADGESLHAILLHGGTLYDPQHRGTGSVLSIDGKVASVGALDAVVVERALHAIGVELEVIDVRGCIVAPGLIDPHEHLLGSSGERGFSSRGPEIFCTELLGAGITTVVGTLGTDNTMRTLAELLAKVKGLEEEGITALMYSGGYTLPPMTLMDTLRNDILFIDEVIGAGEIAVSDNRALQPEPRDLATVITDAFVGGLLSRKAGITHIHVGEGKARLQPVTDALDSFELEPRAVYVTHVARTTELLQDAAALSRRGSFVDIDTTDHGLPGHLCTFVDAGGDLSHLTVSTDAGSSSPHDLMTQIAAAVAAGWPIERVLPLVTTNTAAVLNLPAKGRLAQGCDADIVVLEPRSFVRRHVVAGGRLLLRDREITRVPPYLEDSNRRVELYGEAE
jgi:beta-aspartyl-dipeptidase (metallo-type)